jgi:hypothetical protein
MGISAHLRRLEMQREMLADLAESSISPNKTQRPEIACRLAERRLLPLTLGIIGRWAEKGESLSRHRNPALL